MLNATEKSFQEWTTNEHNLCSREMIFVLWFSGAYDVDGSSNLDKKKVYYKFLLSLRDKGICTEKTQHNTNTKIL